MALVLADRVKETSVTVGTGTFTLDGAVNGYQSFAAAIGGGNTCYYTIAGQVSSDWEVGIGTVGTGTLARTTVLSSSNSGSLVNFIAGTKDVFVTYPAERSIYLDSAGSYPVQNTFNTLNAANAVLTAGTISTTPAASTDIVNKTYVDTLVSSGVHFHTPVRVESPNTAGNLNATYNNGTAGVGATLTNAGTQAALVIDGVTVAVSDRVLIYNQTNATQNGVYTVTNTGSVSTNWVLTRSTDTDTYGIDSPNSLSQGSTFFVSAGNTGAGETYTCNTVGVITFGTTNITFAQISSAQIYSAGTGLTLSSTTFSITNTAVTAGSYGSASSVPNYSVNAQGQLTFAANTPIAITSAAVSGLAASATTDTTNASNISSGTLPTARLSGSYTGITEVGTIAAGTWQGSAIGPTYGGTGFTGYTTGDVLYANTATTLAKLAAGTNGYVLTMAGGIPSWAASSDVTTFSAGTTGLTPSTATSGAVTLAGTLAIANGGTGATTNTNARTNLGATTLGANLFTITNPSAITFPRFNADNTVSALDADTFRTAIGAGTSSTTGTVTSVAASVPAFLSVSGSPITTSGTLAISYSGTALPVANGGTGLTSVTANRIPYGNGTSALNTSANLTFDGTTLTNTGNAVISDNSANAALRITQVGAGNALLVEDEANPDATPFVVSASGLVGVGTTSPTSALTVEGLTEVRSGNYLMLRPTGNSWDMRLQAVSTQLNFYSGGDLVNPIVSMQNGGNVGVGTTNPSLWSRLAVSDSNGTGFTGLTSINSNANIGIAGIQFASDTTYTKAAIGLLRQSPNGVGALVFYNDSNTDAASWGTGDEKMRITSSGAISFGSSGTATGTSGQVLTSAGSGASPTWTNASSNITTQGLYENNATISANYTIGTGNNAISAGPITVNSGVVVTVPSGSTWVVV